MPEEDAAQRGLLDDIAIAIKALPMENISSKSDP